MTVRTHQILGEWQIGWSLFLIANQAAVVEEYVHSKIRLLHGTYAPTRFTREQRNDRHLLSKPSSILNAVS